MMPASRLLKSCAMPPVRWPIASMRCAWRSWASSCARSAAARLRPAAVEDRHRAHLHLQHRAVLAVALHLEIDRLAGDHAAVHLLRQHRLLGPGEEPALTADHFLAREA